MATLTAYSSRVEEENEDEAAYLTTAWFTALIG